MGLFTRTKPAVADASDPRDRERIAAELRRHRGATEAELARHQAILSPLRERYETLGREFREAEGRLFLADHAASESRRVGMAKEAELLAALRAAAPRELRRVLSVARAMMDRDQFRFPDLPAPPMKLQYRTSAPPVPIVDPAYVAPPEPRAVAYEAVEALSAALDQTESFDAQKVEAAFWGAVPEPFAAALRERLTARDRARAAALARQELE
jgi:hypothetical protein